MTVHPTTVIPISARIAKEAVVPTFIFDQVMTVLRQKNVRHIIMTVIILRALLIAMTAYLTTKINFLLHVDNPRRQIVM